MKATGLLKPRMHACGGMKFMPGMAGLGLLLLLGVFALVWQTSTGQAGAKSGTAAAAKALMNMHLTEMERAVDEESREIQSVLYHLYRASGISPVAPAEGE